MSFQHWVQPQISSLGLRALNLCKLYTEFKTKMLGIQGVFSIPKHLDSGY